MIGLHANSGHPVAVTELATIKKLLIGQSGMQKGMVDHARQFRVRIVHEIFFLNLLMAEVGGKNGV